MKKAKVMAILVAVLMAVVPVFACAAEVTGSYISTQDLGFISAYPQFTFKQATFGAEMLETYDDGTYCLTVTKTAYSGLLLFNDDGTTDVVPRGTTITRYYGTYEGEEDSGLLMLTLSAPTAVSVLGDSSAAHYMNTAAWTEEMSNISANANTGATAEEYLASMTFEAQDVVVDLSTYTFDYFDVAPMILPGA